MQRVASFFPDGFSAYVPKMQFAAGMMESQPMQVSLGTPAAADNDIIDTDIDADAVAGSETLQNWTADSPFGRSVTMNANADPGNAAVVDVYGFDYLGQPMIERFTHVSGSTPIIYGRKAFRTITKTRIITAASNATTFDLGTGFRLGLPYKGDVVWARENGVLVPVYSRPFRVAQDWSDADTTAGGSKYIRSPCPGYITALWGIMGTGGSTTNAATTVELATVAVTGLTITLDQDANLGVIVSDEPTTVGYNANNRFITDDTIEIVHAATTAGGQMTVGITIQPVQFMPRDATDPATRVTGDPRGTYEALAVYDGSLEVEVAMFGDPAYNASGNGGLHGLPHFTA